VLAGEGLKIKIPSLLHGSLNPLCLSLRIQFVPVPENASIPVLHANVSNITIPHAVSTESAHRRFRQPSRNHQRRRGLAFAFEETAGSCQCDRVIEHGFADPEIAIDPIVHIFVLRNRISLETRPIIVSWSGLVFLPWPKAWPSSLVRFCVIPKPTNEQTYICIWQNCWL